MYREIEISADIPEAKLMRAFKTGQLTLSKHELAGSGAKLFLHPESASKVDKACKCGKGVRLQITRHEVGYPFKRNIGGSIFTKIWKGIKSAFKWTKDNGVLSKVADLAVPALTSAAPELAPAIISGRNLLKQNTGIGVSRGRLVKGSPEAKAHMAAIRAKRKMQAGSFHI